MLDEILECIEDEDVDRMMELFSDYALEENDVLDEELEELNDDFPEIDEVRNNSSRCIWHYKRLYIFRRSPL